MFWRTFVRFSVPLTITRGPCKLEVETLTEGRIFLVEFYKRNRINFDFLETIIYPWTRGYGQLVPKVFNLSATEIKTKELKIHAEGMLANSVLSRSFCCGGGGVDPKKNFLAPTRLEKIFQAF